MGEAAAHRGGPRVIARFRGGTGSIDPPRTGRVTVTDDDAALGAGFKRLLRNP